ncbi:MAG TPA: type II toxin-antitoxin system ParD family antitoxin [Acidobacteriaceae bacterium]|jgi:antitoxin ParD1/3/4|nr:type II toxin-antitoxin system ParD family antitoxin [Acidobacteriaceae bacterium]
MPTRNVSLTEELDSYVEQSVQSGYYDSASEVVRAAIRALKQSELEDKAKVEALRTAIAEGLKGPFLDGPTVMAEMRERVRLRAEANRQKSNVA